MEPFEFFMGAKVLFGRGKAEMLSGLGSEFGNRALLVYGKGAMKTSGVLDQVKGALTNAGKEVIIFEGVEANPSMETVEKGARVVREEGCSFIVGLGGGSALDAAKGIAVAATHPGSIWEYVEGHPERKLITRTTLPLVLIPTTSGTGSETTPYAVITHRTEKVKDTLVSPFLYPKIAIVDPLLAVTMSPELTAMTGMDAFCHALEGYTSRLSQPLTDLIALDALERLIRYMPRAVADGKDMEARDNQAWGAALAGMVIGQTGCTLVHAMSHTVSARFPVPHGAACALLTPAAVRFNLRSNLEKYARLSSLFGLDTKGMPVEKAAEKAAPLIEEFIRNAGIRMSLREMGMREESIQDCGDDTLKMGAFGCNRISPNAAEVAHLFEEAIDWVP